MRNKINVAIRAARKSYFEDLVKNSIDKGKTILSVLKKLVPKDRKPETLSLNVDGKQITDKVGIANAFNTYFVSIGRKLAEKFSHISLYSNLDNP